MTIIIAIINLLGGGVIIHFYREWRERRKEDRTYINDQYRYLLEDERATRKRIDEIMEAIKNSNIELLKENIALKSKKERAVK